MEFDVLDFRERIRSLIDAKTPIDQQNAVKYVSGLVSCHPTSSQLLCVETDLIQEFGFSDEYPVRDRYLKAVELDPLNSYAYESLGHLSSLEGKPREAKDWFEQSLEAREHVNALRGLLDIHRQLNEMDDYRETLDNLLDYIDELRNRIVATAQLAGVHTERDGTSDQPN